MTIEELTLQEPPRRLIALRLLGATASAALLVALYFVVPLELLVAVPVWATLVISMLILLVVAIWQIHAVLRSNWPGLRGIEALAITAPLYLLLFATIYARLAGENPKSFSTGALTRLDLLYFTVTVFATVGFGDISPASQPARGLVTTQMILNLLVLGAGIRVLTLAVKRGRQLQDLGETKGAPAR